MSETVVKPCSCVHKYQDEKYGKGKRVHNIKTARKNNSTMVCTVCGTSK
jgi:hypothetical protein